MEDVTDQIKMENMDMGNNKPSFENMNTNNLPPNIAAQVRQKMREEKQKKDLFKKIENGEL